MNRILHQRIKEAVKKLKSAMCFKREVCIIDNRVYFTPEISRISVVNNGNVEPFDNPTLSKAVDIIKGVILADYKLSESEL